MSKTLNCNASQRRIDQSQSVEELFARIPGLVHWKLNHMPKHWVRMAAAHYQGHADLIQEIQLRIWRELPDFRKKNITLTTFVCNHVYWIVAKVCCPRPRTGRIRTDYFWRRYSREPAAEDVVDQEDELEFVLSRLLVRDRKILRLRMEGCTFDQVGKRMGVTRERARQYAVLAVHRAQAALMECN